MKTVSAQAQPGAMRAFVTPGGAHSPQTLAEMTLCQLTDPNDNPAKVEELRSDLIICHNAIQHMIRRMFALSTTDDAMRRRIIDVIARDFATSLDIERQLYKG